MSMSSQRRTSIARATCVPTWLVWPHPQPWDGGLGREATPSSLRARGGVEVRVVDADSSRLSLWTDLSLRCRTPHPRAIPSPPPPPPFQGGTACAAPACESVTTRPPPACFPRVRRTAVPHPPLAAACPNPNTAGYHAGVERDKRASLNAEIRLEPVHSPVRRATPLWHGRRKTMRRW